MKKVIALISIVTLLFSCKADLIGGFDSLSAKADLTKKLNKSEWKASSSSSHFSKIEFDDQIIILTTVDGNSQRVGFDVTNISSTSSEMPESIQLRLKSHFLINEIYLNKEYSTLQNYYLVDEENEEPTLCDYIRVK